METITPEQYKAMCERGRVSGGRSSTSRIESPQSPDHGNPDGLPSARARRTPGRMNRLEASYAKHLESRKHAGEVAAYWFEAMALRIGDRCFWHPDFCVCLADGAIELHDTKGFCRDDAMVKAKAVADKYPFTIYFVYFKKGQWSYQRIGR